MFIVHTFVKGKLYNYTNCGVFTTKKKSIKYLISKIQELNILPIDEDHILLHSIQDLFIDKKDNSIETIIIDGHKMFFDNEFGSYSGASDYILKWNIKKIKAWELSRLI